MSLLRQLAGRLTWRFVLLWGVLASAVWSLAELTDAVYDSGGSGFAFDEPVLRWFRDLRTPALTRVMVALSVVGDVPVTLGATVALLLVLLRVARRTVVFFVLAMGGASLIMLIGKEVVARARPDLFPGESLYPVASPSFPSGHATGSAALALALFLIVRRVAPRWRALVGALGALYALSVSASRLYLGVHYPSDVLAGIALSAVWVAGVHALLYRQRVGTFLLVRLPDDVAEAVHDAAEAREVEVDDWVAGALREALAGPGPTPEPAPGDPARAAAPRAP